MVFVSSEKFNITFYSSAVRITLSATGIDRDLNTSKKDKYKEREKDRKKESR